MTYEEIIRIAREAGIPIEIDWAGRPSTLVIKNGGTYLRGTSDLERFAALVAKHTLANIDPSSLMSWQEGYAAGATAENEACAKVCEDAPEPDGRDLADRIRARGQK